MVDGTGTTTYSYDSRNQLTSLEGPGGPFAYAYDANGNITSRTYPDATVVAETYDADGRLASVSADGKTSTYSYNPDSQLAKTTLPVSNGYEETATYDRAGRMASIEAANESGALTSFAYTYDAAGNPTQVATESGGVAYGYDEDERLASACYGASCAGGSLEYSYDADGNRTQLIDPSGTTTYSYDVAGRLIEARGPSSTTTYGYDAEGRRTSAGSTTYAWNAADQLTSVVDPSASTAFSYGGDGNRTSEASGEQTTDFAYDVNNPLPLLAQEEAGEGGARRYVWGNGLLSMHASGGDSYVAHDSQGSVVGLSSDTGAIQATFSYDPFGNVRSANVAEGAPEIPLRYEGERLDPTGLYYLRARQLDPTLGQFITLDPLPSNPQQPFVSAYVYANNRPTVLSDPSGESSVGGGLDCSMLGQDTCRVAASYLTVYGPNHGLASGLSPSNPAHDAGSTLFSQAANRITGTNIGSYYGAISSGYSAYHNLSTVNRYTNQAASAYGHTYTTVDYHQY
jgi:RHS repeat-associated protein